VEGNTGSKSTSISDLDVYDSPSIARKTSWAQGLPANAAARQSGDAAFLNWPKEDCVKIVADRTGKVGLTGSLMGGSTVSTPRWTSTGRLQLRAFARLEMWTRISPLRTPTTCLHAAQSGWQPVLHHGFHGGKVGSGKLIGANEGERLMRPFDASLADEKGKNIVAARHLDFVGGYAGCGK